MTKIEIKAILVKKEDGKIN